MNNLTDTHCHLFKEYFKDLEQVLARSRDSGLTLALVPGYDIETSLEAIDLARREQGILAAVGVHPTSGFECPKTASEELEIILERETDAIAAVGETGIDLFHSTEHENEQRELFHHHLKLAQKFDKPVIIHSRNSASSVVDTLKEASYNGRGIFHCFDGSTELLNCAVARGFGVSFAGNVTYPGAKLLREAVKSVPDDLILVETDSPFLSPRPFRGRRNEPAHVVHTLRAVAGIKNWKLEEASSIVRANFLRILYGGK